MVGLCGYHFVVAILHSLDAAAIRRAGIDSHGSLADLLCLIDLALASLFGLMAFVMTTSWRFKKFIELLGVVGIVLTYYWWYSDKFSFIWIAYEVKEGSAEYNQRLAEIGFLIGATYFDYVAFFLAIFVSLGILGWVLIRKD